MTQQLVFRSSWMTGFAALAVTLAGCNADAQHAPDPQHTQDAPDPQDSQDSQPPSQALSYYRDVKPIIDQKCIKCHTDGGIAPFSLTTFDQVSAVKDAIVAAVSAGIMPPWPPAKGCSEYADVRSLGSPLSGSHSTECP